MKFQDIIDNKFVEIFNKERNYNIDALPKMLKDTSTNKLFQPIRWLYIDPSLYNKWGWDGNKITFSNIMKCINNKGSFYKTIEAIYEKDHVSSCGENVFKLVWKNK